MERIRIERTGKNPIVFNGKLLGKAEENDGALGKHIRFKISLYKTEYGQYILSSTHHIGGDNIEDHKNAFSFESMSDVLYFIKNDMLISTSQLYKIIKDIKSNMEIFNQYNNYIETESIL
ncbi:MAG: hypothetical protein PHV85_07570 [Desulfovibrionaceae bacterium]|nr:hypothetical protein [Desulfovibrionaceae bacterium]